MVNVSVVGATVAAPLSPEATITVVVAAGIAVSRIPSVPVAPSVIVSVVGLMSMLSVSSSVTLTMIAAAVAPVAVSETIVVPLLTSASCVPVIEMFCATL